MTDLYAEAAPATDLRARLEYALATIGDSELATVIATAGLAAVHDEWQRTRTWLAQHQDAGHALALRIAELTDEARRWKRRWAGAVAQAKHEHAAAEELRGELADYQLAASEHEGAQQREPRQGDHVRVIVEGEYHATEQGPVLTYRPGPIGMATGFWSVPPSATILTLGIAPLMGGEQA